MNRILFVPSVSLLLLLMLAQSSQADMTVYNNSPHNVWICVATYRASSELLSIDASSTHFEPARIYVNGYYEIEAYGGFATVPTGTYMLVLGPNNKRQAKEPKNTEGFPVKKNWGATNLAHTFKSDPYKDTWAGFRQFIERDPSYEMRLFCPVSYFNDGRGAIRITNEKLGW